MEKKVTILMTSYNGERFIKEQIKSLLNQTYKNIQIIISDDGSTDATVDIIRKYMKYDQRIILEMSDHKGACKNFSFLLNKYHECDYIMLCDQDDVWDEKKVEKTLCAMKEAEKADAVATLVYCGKRYVDENLKEIDLNDLRREDSLRNILFKNHIYGCTMMINKSLLALISIPEYATMHDHWIALLAAHRGKIVRISDKLINYRLHSENVTGGINQFSLKNKFVNWRKVNESIKKGYQMTYLYSVNNCHDNKTMRDFVNLWKHSGLMKLLLALKFGAYLGGGATTIRWLYVLMVTSMP